MCLLSTTQLCACYIVQVWTVVETLDRIPEPLIELVTQRLRVLGEPTRIRLLDRLCDGPAAVRELRRAVGTSQQNVSERLAILHAAGRLTRTKDVTHRFPARRDRHAAYVVSDPPHPGPSGAGIHLIFAADVARFPDLSVPVLGGSA